MVEEAVEDSRGVGTDVVGWVGAREDRVDFIDLFRGSAVVEVAFSRREDDGWDFWARSFKIWRVRIVGHRGYRLVRW